MAMLLLLLLEFQMLQYFLAVPGGAAVTAAGRAAFAAGRASVTAAGVASATCLADAFAAVVPALAAALLLIVELLLMALLSFSPPRPLSCVFAILTSEHRGMLAALLVHVQRIGAGEVDALVASSCFKN
jgi:hypothetical protein